MITDPTEDLKRWLATQGIKFPPDYPPEPEPYAWAIDACSRMWSGEHAEIDAKAEAARCGGTCTAFPLYKELK